ncbi:hypothetical protein ETB97_012050 [Aspergillus alliaceus]|uniref:ABC transporter domain-containing protein n=1 Tax=Petromyces alliaceus TaxID=209559 RepID=A0A8H6AA77_PETAA|nr:hypothetical protein ETB97_012050 [Aspergillus burnettii]
MSYLGSFSPRPSRLQAVLSHNTPQEDINMELNDMVQGTAPLAHLEGVQYEETEHELDRESTEAMEHQVGELAKQLTRESTRLSSSLDSPFAEKGAESTINPHSPNFKPKDWIKTLLAIQSRDPERYPEFTVGVSFRNLSIHGFGYPTDYQKDVFNSLLGIGSLFRWLIGQKGQKVEILRNFDGMVKSGEMLLVLGRPGSGCSTFLKTIAGEMNGIEISKEAVMNYQGIPVHKMQKAFKGEAIYTAETDVHFPNLTVGDTLSFAAHARAPRHLLDGVTPDQYAQHMRDVVMAMLGLSHTVNTRVGNDFVRGVSGGERKRVSIAEATLSQAPIQCWDNSTRGLDSANALEFCKNLALISKYAGTAVCVAIYQASQNAYDVFDKVTVLYEGRQIYFGPTSQAKQFFINLGFECPERQTTADFLTSLTSPNERKARPGFEDRVPRTPDEFAAVWKQSQARHQLVDEIKRFEMEYPVGGESYQKFISARKTIQAKRQRVQSPYAISVWDQTSLCIGRGFQRLRADFSMTATALIGNFTISLILASVFYNLPNNTSSFYSRGVLLFYAVLLSAFSSALEILTLYAQRPIVEKQSRRHLWRNMGILMGFMVFFGFIYLLATEYISEEKSKGEVLLFRRGQLPKSVSGGSDEESPTGPAAAPNGKTLASQTGAKIQRQTAIFHWQDVCYDIKVKGQSRRILDHVDGWVKPGTCTALMGVSGAGKTTLLDVLATRVTTGVITGEMLVDGSPRDQSFQRKTGYVQQQDLHLATSTVREALRFSALLRQPAHICRQEKLDYVEEVIALLGMETYADAVVGVPGEGLNVEQRKRLTIGVELAAKPQLLLFLDEPTSGLDSQTSWSILDLIDTLTKHGQAILCTIHQPSAMLFQRFDRLLFLAKGGKTIYFGEIGQNSTTLARYFERNGAHPLSPGENPAEWMLDVIGAAPGSHSDIDWHQVWRQSPEFAKVKHHLTELKSGLHGTPTKNNTNVDEFREYAAPFYIQLWECLKRVFSQYYRTPSYIWSKATLCVLSGLYIGFSFFDAKNSLQGLQNQMFSVFMLLAIFGNLVEQIMPHFVTQRSLYEVRERPSKTYSWKAFMTANIIVELPWNTLMSVLMFLCWYYPIGFYNNAKPTQAVTERGGLMFLFIWTFLLFTSTFAHMIIAGIELPETAGNVATVLFSLCLIFCGVLATPEQMPGFWIFMYRVSPFTYLISGMLSTGVSGTSVSCDSLEFLHFNPPDNLTCGQYMNPFIAANGGGYLRDAEATADCAFCPASSTDTFLHHLSISFSDAWRNLGLMWVYIAFNIFAAVLIYWLARVPKHSKAWRKS